MKELTILAQLTVAISVAYVWVFRFHNVLYLIYNLQYSSYLTNMPLNLHVLLITFCD